jgi:protein TonB
MPSSAKDTENRVAEDGGRVVQSNAADSSNQSQISRGVAASCEIPVEVHGSQKAGTQYHAVTPFHEETRTVIVFPHGCVLRLSTAVTVGQMLALTNQNTQRSMLSRVTHVRSYPNLKSYVEIEFTQVDPGFWSIDFEEESAAQGFLPAPSSAHPGTAKSDDFWSPSQPGAPAQSALAASQDRVRPVEPDSTVPHVNAPGIAPPAPQAETTSALPQVSDVAPTTIASKAPESSIAAPESKPSDDVPSSQSWAELLVMEPQQQLSAKELAATRSDVEESLAPAPLHEENAHAEPLTFETNNPEPISASVLKELEKLALEHVAEKRPARSAASQSESQVATDASPLSRPRTESNGPKTSTQPPQLNKSNDSRRSPRPSPLRSFTAGISSHEPEPSPLHSFTGAPPVGGTSQGPLHSFTPPAPSADPLAGVVDGINPHKTQSLADHTADSGAESDFGNFLRDPEPRGASQQVFAGPADAIASRPAEAHASLAPLRARKSKSGAVLAALVVILGLIVAWWFYPVHGNAPSNNVVPAASAPSPSNSPSQWPSQSPSDAATLDPSAGHPVAVESRPATSPAAPPVESKSEPDAGAREIIPVPRPSSKPPATPGKPEPQAANGRTSLPSMTLAAPTSSSNASAQVSAEPPPDLSPAEAARARENSFPGIVGSAPANVPAPAPAAPSGPVAVGGRVKEPRLISSVKPLYPQPAIQANVQGDVRIEATIDETGRVTKMKVISGPALLQRAATDALKQWRYEPSILNDKPVAVDMVVTIRFHR